MMEVVKTIAKFLDENGTTFHDCIEDIFHGIECYCRKTRICLYFIESSDKVLIEFPEPNVATTNDKRVNHITKQTGISLRISDPDFLEKLKALIFDEEKQQTGNVSADTTKNIS